MLRLTLVAVICTLALALPAEREKRQVSNCLNAFTNVPNPCENNPQNQVYFPHPSDNSKFIQCDRYGRMYIIQCPENLLYSVTTSTCRAGSGTAVNPAPNSGTAVISSGSSGNPCTPEALAAGKIYFAVAGDQTKFIECDMLGHANIMPCPDTLVWDEARLSCVYAFTVGGGTATGTGTGSGTNTGTGSGTGTGSTSCSGSGSANSPCTAAAIQSNKLFYPHPDPTKFFQCDLWCDAFVVSCPAGLVWNQYYETCASAYLQVTGRK